MLTQELLFHKYKGPVHEHNFFWNTCKLCISFPFSFAFHFSFLSYKSSSDNLFAFLHFFFLGMDLVTTSCEIL